MVSLSLASNVPKKRVQDLRVINALVNRDHFCRQCPDDLDRQPGRRVSVSAIESGEAPSLSFEMLYPTGAGDYKRCQQLRDSLQSMSQPIMHFRI